MRLVVAVTAGVGLIAAVIWLGKLAGDDVRDRNSIVIDQLEVLAPPGVKRADFLAEVRYLSKLPARVDRTDANTVDQIKQAFGKHPWVETVAVGDLKLPQPVVVTLRTPTLIVSGRVLDRLGVLLPLRTPIIGLPDLRTSTNATFGQSGKPFGDPEVVDAAQRMGWLRINAADIEWQAVELTNDGVVLIRGDGAKAIWGKGEAKEPTQEQKLKKLRDWKGGDIDLRK